MSIEKGAVSVPQVPTVAHICRSWLMWVRTEVSWCPTFARVGAPDEARLVGVTRLTWGCFLLLSKRAYSIAAVYSRI
jgi:hypothetical protein